MSSQLQWSIHHLEITRDLIDYDEDNNLSVAITKDNNPPAVEDVKLKIETQSSIIEEVEVLKAQSKDEEKQIVSEAHVPDAELGVASLTEAMLIQAPNMASAFN